MNTTRPRYGYSLTQRPDGHYSHLDILIRAPGSSFGPDESALIRWQADDERRHDDGKGGKTFSPWYGLRITVETRDAETGLRLSQTVARAFKLIRERKGDDYALRSITPENVLWALAALKLPRLVYDPRTSEHTPVAKLPASYLQAYTDGHTLTVLAADEADAQRKLAVALSQYSLSSVETWIANGKPARLTRDPNAPTVESEAATLEIVFARREREARETAAAQTAAAPVTV